MTVKKIKSSDILGDNYYTYDLTSSNYTPNLNSSITITCTVKNIYGDIITNKSVQLYQNDVTVGNAKTTNNNGVVTWTVTCSTAGVQKFSVKDNIVEIFVDTTSKTGHNHTTSDITNFPTIPTKTSDLTNDIGFLTEHNPIDSQLSPTSTNAVQNKVVNAAINNIGPSLTAVYEGAKNYTDGVLGGYVSKNDIQNDLTSTDVLKVLSANQGKELKTLIDGKASSSHSHGNITNDGKLGSTANKPLMTTTNGLISLGSFGNSANSFCEGNDSRLSDSRTPKAHTHITSEITNFPILSNVATTGNYNDLNNLPTIPTKTSDLTNDSNFLSQHQDITGKEDKSNKITSWSNTSSDTKYPSEKLVKDELDNKANSSDIPTNNNQLVNGAGYITSSTLVSHNTSDAAHSDIRNILSNKADSSNIPTKTSDLTNDSNFLTSHQDISGKEDKTNKSSSISTDTGSTTKYPTVKAVEDYAVQKTTPKNISELTTLLDNATTGDTITLTDDYIAIDYFNYLLSKDITINGNGHTIDANNNPIYFQFASTKTLKIINCHFKNLKSYDIMNCLIADPMSSSTIIFDNCIFDKGSVKKALIYVKTGYLKMNNCLFKDILLNSSGQIISILNSDCEIYNTYFEGNTITPIRIKNTSLKNNIIKDCVFNNNIVAVLNESAESYQNTILENNLFLQSGDTLTGCVNKNYLTTHQDISGKANTVDLSTVAISGSYDDLTNKPTIPTVPTNVSAFTNDSGYLTSHQDISGKANISDLSTVATSGSYNDLSNKPSIPSKTSDLTNDSNFISTSSTNGLIKNNGTIDSNTYLTTSVASSTYVAKETGKGLFSGSYNDLTNKPTIPSAYTHPLTHSSSMITDDNTHTNIGNTSNTLENIITNIDSKLGSLANVDLIEVTSTLPTASLSTLNKLYLIAESSSATNDNYEIYVTVRTGTSGNYSYAWEKVDTARIDLSNYLTTTNAQQTYVAKENGKGLFSGSYTDLTNKPSYTATVTSSTTDSVKIGSININGSNVDIYAKDTVYTHPNDLNTTKTSGLYKIALNSKGHVTSATSVEKSDITNLGIASTDLANGTTNGLSSNDYTTTEKNKLANLHTVATSGSYNDLTNKPSIPTQITVDNTVTQNSSNPVKSSGIYSALLNKQNSLTNLNMEMDYYGNTIFSNNGELFYSTNNRVYHDYSDTNELHFIDSNDNDVNFDDIILEGDSRLTDARTPTSHTHPISNVTNLQSTLNGKADTSALGSVAFSNDYTDLDNKPSIPTVPTNVSSFTNDSNYVTANTVSSTYLTKTDASNTYQPKGNYLTTDPFIDDLSTSGLGIYPIRDNGEVIYLFDGRISWDLESVYYDDIPFDNFISTSSTSGLIKNDGSIDTNTYLTSHQDISGKANTSDLGDVAFSNDYEDLDNLPTIPSAYTHPSTHPASMITGLSTVATTGSYNNLTNKPSIPTITQTITDGDTTNVPSADAVQNTIDALLDNIIFQLRS